MSFSVSNNFSDNFIRLHNMQLSQWNFDYETVFYEWQTDLGAKNVETKVRSDDNGQ